MSILIKFIIAALVGSIVGAGFVSAVWYSSAAWRAYHAHIGVDDLVLGTFVGSLLGLFLGGLVVA